MEAKLSIVVDTNFCQKHRDLLISYLREHDLTRPSLRPLVSLACHNLEQDARDILVEIAITTVNVLLFGPLSRRERVVVECLIVSVFRDQHIVFVSDDEDHRTVPDVVVVMIDGLAVQAIFQEYANTRSQLILMGTPGEPLPHIPSGLMVRIAVLGSAINPLYSRRHLPFTQASIAFGGSIHHTPLSLIGVSQAGVHPRSFCVSNYARCNSFALKLVTSLLEQIEAVDTVGMYQESQSIPRFAFDRSPTEIDNMIELDRRYKFIIAFDEMESFPEDEVSERIAMALISGDIPIYYGQSQAVVNLFNPRAFVNCGQFVSFESCVEYAKQLHQTPSLYEMMRQEASILNKTAFVEAFSWHPQVAEMGVVLLELLP